jgi:hypothetical protein
MATVPFGFNKMYSCSNPNHGFWSLANSMILLEMFLKLAFAGVFPSASKVSQRTRIAFGIALILNGSGHLKTGFMMISEDSVLA